MIVAGPFARMSYTQAIEVLARAPRTFERVPTWGEGLGADMEKWLAEE